MTRLFFPIIVLMFLIVAPARADTITLVGTNIPLRDCDIQDLKSGQVIYLDTRGRRQRYELAQVAALGFDDLPLLDEAEAQLADDEQDVGLRTMLRALHEAEEDLHRIWLRLRLVHLHTARKENVAAAGHLAALFVLREDSAWRALEPRSGFNTCTYDLAAEAMHNLRAAKGAVVNRESEVVLDRLIEQITPLYQAARAEFSGPAWEPGTTISGIPIDEFLGRTPPQPPPPEADTGAPAEVEREASPAQTSRGGDSADGIAALIDAGRTGEALTICQRIARRPGSRGVSRFLYQYGQCLAAEDQPRDAALMFMRCAILYDQSAWSAPSLIATAEIYLREFNNPATARRLLTRAIELATSRGQAEHVEAAQSKLRGLEERSP